jgi:hypothetical protein
MKLRVLLIIGLVSLALLASFGVVLAQERSTPGGAASTSGSGEPASPLAVVGSGFTYQGQLKSGNNPVNGTCDFQFRLYDALVGGAQVGVMQTIPAVSVANGVFTVVLNSSGEFGLAFTGDARYLAIAVRCPTGSGSFTLLTPRQTLSAAPYALSLKPEASISATITGTGILTDAGVLKVANEKSGYCDWAVGVRATAGIGSTGFVYCDDAAIYGNGETAGVLGTGDIYGVAGISRSSYGWGLFGRADGDNGTGLYINTSGGKGKGISVNAGGEKGTGIFVNTFGQESNAIYAINYSTAITEGFGIYSIKGDQSGYDLLEHNYYPGAVVGDTGVGNGVIGLASSDYGIGVMGIVTGTADKAVAGYAYGDIYSSIGVYGESHATLGYGVYGSGEGSSAYGVYGFSNQAVGVYGYTGSLYYGIGVIGVQPSYSTSDFSSCCWNPAGFFGGRNGVIAVTKEDGGYGVTGIYASTTGSGYAIYGKSNSPNTTAIYGENYAGGSAGYFAGDVYVIGNLSASGTKPFRIDYPLDPANKYLYHYAVESPQVQNQYNGTVTLDTSGEAVVDLPVYFSSVNTGPFQYQLTAIGAPGPNLYIAQEVTGNQFKIAGGTPGMKVSWLLFGLRNDPWIQDHPQTDVADKPANEAGKYVYPQGYGQPATLQLGFLQQDNPLHLMQPVAPQLPQQNTGTPGTTNVPQPQQPNNVPGSSTSQP